MADTEHKDPIMVLAGKEYPVPKLRPRQWTRALPILRRMMPAITAARATPPDQPNVPAIMATMDETVYDAMLDCVALALQLSAPELTKEKLLDMEITPAELIGAVGVVLQQSTFPTKETARG